MRRFSALAAFALCVTCLLQVGCGSKTKSNQSADNEGYEASDDGDDQSEAEVIEPTDNGNEQPPTTGTHASIPVDAEPELIVSKYIEALNSGNVSLAEHLLTDVARVETRAAELMPQPAWSNNAAYHVQGINYATERSVRAEVQTEWTERDEFGGSADFTIVWMLYKQPHNGWRISGMKTHFIPGGDLVFLNFEDPEDMIRRWESGIEIAERPEDGRQQSNGDGTQIR